VLVRLALSVSLACWLSGCAPKPPQAPPPAVVARLPQQVVEPERPKGVQLVTLPRATPGVVRLALYIDAGARDAELPQTATLAAWIAESSDPQIKATLFPDVTELALLCSPEEVSLGIEKLARALAVREPTPDMLSRARTRLRDGQRRALAHDAYGTADRSALTALLGSAAAGFFPLGTADTDLIAASEAVPDFLHDHYGPERAQLVAAGDLDPHSVRSALSELDRTPHARMPRQNRALSAHEPPQLDVAFDQSAALSFALAAEDTRTLHAAVQRLSAQLSANTHDVNVSAQVFAARSGALALVHVASLYTEATLEHAARELVRLSQQPALLGSNALPAPKDDLISISREIGLRFGAEGDATPHTLHFAAGLSLRPSYDAGPTATPPAKGAHAQVPGDAERAQNLQGLWRAALAQAAPEARGDIDNYVAAVTLDNGAKIDVQFSQGESVAIAVRIGVGAELDSPLTHGQAALLSTLTSVACAGMGPELVRARFASLGATLEARVDSESYGLALTVPKDHYTEALDLALRCARTPSRDPHDLVYAGVLLQQRLKQADASWLLRARAAEVLAPRAPGALAPWGDPDRIANITSRDLEDSLFVQQSGARWAVAVVGPVQVRETVESIAQRLGDLSRTREAAASPLDERGAALEDTDAPAASSPLRRTPSPLWNAASVKLPTHLPHIHSVDGVKVLTVWTAHGRFEHTIGARLYARALAVLLGAMPGIQVLAHEGDVYRETGFAALGLHVEPRVVQALPRLLTSVARSMDDAWLARALKPGVEGALNADNIEQAQGATRAEHAARSRLGAHFESANTDDASRLFKALRDSRPGIAPMPGNTLDRRMD